MSEVRVNEGRDQRRYPRFEASIVCTLKLREGPLQLITSDVSRHGAFLRTDAPRPERELIQIHFETPVGALDAMCMVVRAYPLSKPGPRGPGMGVDFFAISKEAKDLWDSFVADVKIRGHDRGQSGASPVSPSALGPSVLSPPAGIGGPATTRGARAAKPPRAEAPSLERAPARPDVPARAPVERQHVRQKACFVVRMADKSRLRDFLSTDVSQGGMFLRTPVLRARGDLVELVVVHPETQQEYPLAGTVVRVVDHADEKRRGLGIRFDPLTGERLSRLVEFIETGAAALRAQQATGEHRLVELQRKAREEPGSADTQVAMGVTLLERGDGPEALSALTKALVLAPDRLDVHRALEHAYRVLGDEARARAHANVADALARQPSSSSSSLARSPLSAAS